MICNDNELVLACLHAAIELNQGVTCKISDPALAYRMKRIAEDLIHAVDVYETNEVEEEMRL